MLSDVRNVNNIRNKVKKSKPISSDFSELFFFQNPTSHLFLALSNGGMLLSLLYPVRWV